MISLASAPSRVHSKRPIGMADAPEPIDTTDHSEPFTPGPLELAYDLAWRLARDGEPTPLPAEDLPTCLWLAAVRGKYDGRKAREVAEARELGHALGLSGSGIGEPPMGFLSHEKAAYREGFAAGTAEDERDTAARIASEELDRLEDAFTCPDYDHDYFPIGYIG